MDHSFVLIGSCLDQMRLPICCLFNTHTASSGYSDIEQAISFVHYHGYRYALHDRVYLLPAVTLACTCSVYFVSTWLQCGLDSMFYI